MVHGIGLVARNLRKSFHRGLVPALAGVDLDVAPGERVAVMGPTGCGKSTLLSLLALLDDPDDGEILIDGTPATRFHPAEDWRARNVGIVFQFHHLLPHLTAAENVMLPLVGQRLARSEIASRAQDILERLGLAHRARALAAQLSGGERQLTAVARALVGEPRLILADEPTGSVDSATGERILRILLENSESTGASVVLVTHDPAIARATGRLVLMRDGTILNQGQPAAHS
jgi:ABC-type lipoprotein export system ATPase subunit